MTPSGNPRYLKELRAARRAAREAGGRVTDVEGGKEILAGNVAASNGSLHRRLLQVIRSSRCASS